MTSAIAAAASAVPAYCKPGFHTPAQITACVKAGWDLPTTSAANAGYAAGHAGILPALIVLVIIAALIAAARKGRSGSPAASS